MPRFALSGEESTCTNPTYVRADSMQSREDLVAKGCTFLQAEVLPDSTTRAKYCCPQTRRARLLDILKSGALQTGMWATDTTKAGLQIGQDVGTATLNEIQGAIADAQGVVITPTTQAPPPVVTTPADITVTEQVFEEESSVTRAINYMKKHYVITLVGAGVAMYLGSKWWGHEKRERVEAPPTMRAIPPTLVQNRRRRARR